MANEKVSKAIPVAKRIIEFKSEYVRENFEIMHSSEDSISEEVWKEFARNALVIMDGWHIKQYAAEYPIVRYQCEELAALYLTGGPRLNAFVEQITVSTASYGKSAWFGSGKLDCENTGCDTVVYYTDDTGINHAIIQSDLYTILLKKPKLVVSPEGVLVFYTDEDIIATVDCNSAYHWINGHVINVEGKKIKDIEVCDDFCKVVLIDEEDIEHNYSLKFEFKITEHQMLCPKASEL